MNAIMWKIDNSTDLIKSDAGYSIRWAGCEFEPMPSLTDIAEGELLTQCEQAILTPGQSCERHVCDVGPFGDSVTVIL